MERSIESRRKRGALLPITLLFSTVLWADSLPAEPLYIIERSGKSVLITNRPPKGSQGVRRFEFRRRSVAARGSCRASAAIKQVIDREARERGLDPALVKALVHAESAFNPCARSPKGAIGLMQLMPATARSVGVLNPYEPLQNIRGGVTYLARLLERFEGNVPLSLAAYNAGPGAVAQHGGIPPYAETRSYVKKVLALRERYRNQSQI